MFVPLDTDDVILMSTTFDGNRQCIRQLLYILTCSNSFHANFFLLRSRSIMGYVLSAKSDDGVIAFILH